MKVLTTLLLLYQLFQIHTYPTSCPPTNPEEDTFLPNPYDCNSFYKCSYGIPYLIQCPPKQEWAEHLKRCDWPYVAECIAIPSTSTKSTTMPLETSTPYPTSCTPGYPTDKDILLPNPNDCNSFFKCFNGIPYLIHCPQLQAWDDRLKRCDWPEVARCSDTNE